MTEGKAHRSVFLVSGTETSAGHLAEMLPPGMFHTVRTALSAAEARRRVGETDCEVILINGPLPDESGLPLARDLAARYPVAILLLVKGEQYEQLAGPAEGAGVLVLPKPVARPMLGVTLRLLCASVTRLRLYADRAEGLRRKMEDIRIVNRAKGLLMDRLTMTEPEAHRYIEKQAMDLCRKRRDVAEQIIRTYES